MKAKYKVITKTGEKLIQLKKNGKSYVLFSNEKEYKPLKNGTSVKWGNSERVVDDRVIVFDVDGMIVMTYFNGNAGPELTIGDGSKVKANKLANNFAMSFPLFIALIAIVAIIAVVALIL